ncbi:MAG: hypothetical protein ACOYI5_04925 [Christensenellales bacterium]|jgi:hypothetical protein
MKKVFALIVAALLALSGAAFAEAGDFAYALVDGAACITHYHGADTRVVVPDAIDGYEVAMILGSAFSGNGALTEVTLPATVSYIADGAFLGCASLTSVAILGDGCEFGKLVFDGLDDDFVLRAPAGSTAQSYADAHAISFVAIAVTEAERFAAAIDALDAGEFARAQEMFLALGSYENSKDYYIYAMARVLEQDGEADKAALLYSLVPDILDAQARQAGLENTVGARPIGGGLGKPGERQIAIPAADEKPLPAFHIFANDMPYEFADTSKGDGMYTLYFYPDDPALLTSYRALFAESGWNELEDGPDAEGWSYVFLIDPTGSASFYIAFAEGSDIVVFIYDSQADYGFDPIEGLYR